MYIQKGKIGPSALASSQKGGPFQPISEIAEFQDCLRESMSNSQRMASLASLSSSTIRRPSPAKSSSSSMFGLDQPAFWITLAIGFVVIGIAAWILLGQK
jgi:hypothetical protein